MIIPIRIAGRPARNPREITGYRVAIVASENIRLHNNNITLLYYIRLIENVISRLIFVFREVNEIFIWTFRGLPKC